MVVGLHFNGFLFFAMIAVSVFNITNSSNLNKWLRKERVSLFVNIAAIISVILCIVSIVYLIYQATTIHLANSKSISSMKLQIQTAIDASALQESVPKEQVDHSNIAVKNIFGAATKPAPTPAAAPPISSLELSLIGTFIQTGQQPFAIIEDSKKQLQEVFNIGDSVFDAAKLVKILQDRVEIERDGKIEILRLDDFPDVASGSSATATDGDQFVIAEQEVETALNNLPLLMTQARAVPYFRDGKAVGLRMFAIRPGSIYEKIGLQNGDILKTINGNDMGDMTQALKLFETLKSERSISLTLERAQETKTFNYQIK